VGCGLVMLKVCLFLLPVASASADISPLSLHDALPISAFTAESQNAATTSESSNNAATIGANIGFPARCRTCASSTIPAFQFVYRSEEHTSELQSRENLVCRLLLEKKNPSG